MKLINCKFTISFAFVATVCGVAHGQTPTPTPAPKFKIERHQKSSGRPAVRLIFVDGREAESFVQGPDRIELKSPVSTTENLCFDEMPAGKCDFHSSILHAKVSIQWTKHTESSKVGQTLVSSSGERLEATLDFFGNTSFGQEKSVDEFYAGTEAVPAGLSCSNYGWLTGDIKKTPESFRIESLLGESMVRNSETDNDENRVTDTFHNLVFKKEVGTGVFRSAKRINPKNEFNLPVGQTYSVILGDKSCQITMSHNFGSLVAQYQQKIANVDKLPKRAYQADNVPNSFGSTLDYYSNSGVDYK
jgi:hypothetical protein